MFKDNKLKDLKAKGCQKRLFPPHSACISFVVFIVSLCFFVYFAPGLAWWPLSNHLYHASWGEKVRWLDSDVFFSAKTPSGRAPNWLLDKSGTLARSLPRQLSVCWHKSLRRKRNDAFAALCFAEFVNVFDAWHVVHFFDLVCTTHAEPKIKGKLDSPN